jgi:hypothetical protein
VSNYGLSGQLILFITNRCIGIRANNSNYNVHGTASRAPVLKGRFFHGHQQFLFLLPYILSALMIILNGLQFPQSSVANNINNTILAIWTPSQYYCIVRGYILYYPI